MKRAILICFTALCLAAGVLPSAQEAEQSTSVAASGPSLAPWLDRVDTMLSDGRLDIGRIQEDTMLAGRTHDRLVQQHRGVRVFGGEVVRQMDGRSVVSVFGRLYEGIDIDVTPSIDDETAASVATAAEGDEAVAWGEPELGVLPEDEGGYVLAYRIRVRSPEDIQIYYVNAKNSEIELHYSNLQSQAAIGRGTGVLGDSKKVSVSQSGGTFRANDILRPSRGFTLDFRGNFLRLQSFMSSGLVVASDVATDSDNVWTDSAAVDAHAYQGWVYDYYFKRFGRRGLNDNNIDITGVVHPLLRADRGRYNAQTVAIFINNALYLGDGFMMYGDGDGAIFDYLAGGLDVVAHELTHGVTDFSSRLIYRNEPGALNEAFSDIMGTAVEFSYQPPGSGRLRADWTIGEDVTFRSPGFIRSMASPGIVNNPDHYTVRFTGPEDNGGVHINSGIVNHAFYLAVAGGTNRVSQISVQGIGVDNIERMERIFYRAFAFLLGPSSTFRDARAATLQAATDLYGAGSSERAQLAQAWTAVGVN